MLLLMDNHESHVSINILDKAKANGITMLTFTLHCSHKLQPYDRSVYGPLKRYYNTACNEWQINLEKLSIYDGSELGQTRPSPPEHFSPKDVRTYPKAGAREK